MVTDKQRKKIADYISQLREDFKLNAWEIRVVFEDSFDKPELGGITTPNFAYMRAMITFNSDLLEKMFKQKNGWKEIQYMCRHEMVHVLLNPLVHSATERWQSQDYFIEVHEQVTESITRLITQG